MTESNSAAKKGIWGTLIVVVLIIIGAVYFKPWWTKTHLPPAVTINTANQPTLGNPRAKIHFVVFEDLKCGNCARFNNEVLPYIKKNYIDKGIAQYTMINLAFIPNSTPAANAARCVYVQNPKLFFPYVDVIYSHQPPENQDWATIPTLLNFAGEVPGINIDQLTQCILNSPYDSLMQNNLALAKKIMGEQVATPALYINGIRVNPPTEEKVAEMMNAIK